MHESGDDLLILADQWKYVTFSVCLGVHDAGREGRAHQWLPALSLLVLCMWANIEGGGAWEHGRGEVGILQLQGSHRFNIDEISLCCVLHECKAPLLPEEDRRGARWKVNWLLSWTFNSSICDWSEVMRYKIAGISCREQAAAAPVPTWSQCHVCLPPATASIPRHERPVILP